MTEFDVCALCPRLCRSACPVATGAAREAATPTALAGMLRDEALGRVDRELAGRAAALCTDCGACQAHCMLSRPLPAQLRAARARLLGPPPLAPLAPIQGSGDLIAVETDARPWGEWLCAALGAPVRRWVTADALGVEAIEHQVFAERAAEVATRVGDATVVTSDGGVARVLARAAVRFEWLVDRVPEAVAAGARRGCAEGGVVGVACCGAAGPLCRVHPEDAVRVADLVARRERVTAMRDTRCAALLRRAGHPVTDPVDGLRALVEGR